MSGMWQSRSMSPNGVPANFAPVLHLRHLSSGTLFQTYARSFDRVWDQTSKTWTGQEV